MTPFRIMWSIQKSNSSDYDKLVVRLNSASHNMGTGQFLVQIYRAFPAFCLRAVILALFHALRRQSGFSLWPEELSFIM